MRHRPIGDPTIVTAADILDRAAGTLATRPYVFAFLLGYVVVAWGQIGPKRLTTHLVSGFVIAWASERASITTGFPYGWYFYRDAALSHDLLLLGVPVFDSLSYVFLTYGGYSVAVTVLGPLSRQGTDVQWRATPALRQSLRVAALGATVTMLVDVVVDPIAHKGDEWFLGSIYGYREAGAYFDVPLTNFAGWWLVAFVSIVVLQRADAFYTGRERRRAAVTTVRPRPTVRASGALGVLFVGAVLVFNYGVTGWVGLARARAGNGDGARAMFALLGLGIAWHLPWIVWACLRIRRAPPPAGAMLEALFAADPAAPRRAEPSPEPRPSATPERR